MTVGLCCEAPAETNWPVFIRDGDRTREKLAINNVQLNTVLEDRRPAIICGDVLRLDLAGVRARGITCKCCRRAPLLLNESHIPAILN